ncbi:MULTISPECIES: electron transport complex subunit RsxG [Basfia]|uniref:Ion-translocating oxidoreductase complex subunit G n=2 Tax=Basfia TaxID=697331 RepID=Q65U35_MANSM|nr:MULTISPECIES: electron transport complex subunit RsxG [Basfia]AAU37525.1 NqrC protein [[Mannheimia] succiniciproducens MBEL55E]QIM68316.1 electron transport complex subunit RsxG [Basfia succiniciproducens]SCX91896.1 electron transport complex protein RnfG [Basfia succiniciproducens]SEP94749.1 electron transport complex protein RnfG [Basfia succiniciproducens]
MGVGQTSVKYGAILGIVALICTIISTALYFLTKDKIEAEILKQQQELLAQVIPANYYDNDVTATCKTTESREIEKICTALLTGKVSAYAVEATAPDGYSGAIRLLMGITPEGEVLGVRVLAHKETPGLGDKIETRVSHWILSFNHQKISEDNLQDWAVKKDGGKFDQFAGATITPRAVVNQVKRSALAVLKNEQNNR